MHSEGRYSILTRLFTVETILSLFEFPSYVKDLVITYYIIASKSLANIRYVNKTGHEMNPWALIKPIWLGDKILSIKLHFS